MKKHIIMLAIVCGSLCPHAQAQDWKLEATQGEQQVARSYPLEITSNKTSSIIFPAIIKSVDKGTRDVLVQKAKDVSNVLHIKAARDEFQETNLTVITADGVLHHFTVHYSKDPGSFTFDMGEIEAADDGVAGGPSRLLFSSEVTEAKMEEYCRAITGSKRMIPVTRKGGDKVSFALTGIYIKSDVLFFRVRIRNRSNIDYDVDFQKFYIRDNTRIKRTASQEVEAKVLYRFGAVPVVRGKSENEIVYALSKFTIPDAKHLAIELFEKNGGRHYLLKVKNRKLVRARVL